MTRSRDEELDAMFMSMYNFVQGSGYIFLAIFNTMHDHMTLSKQDIELWQESAKRWNEAKEDFLEHIFQFRENERNKKCHHQLKSKSIN